MLQFITNEKSPVSVVDQIKGFIKGGGRWVQVRMDDASDEEISKVVEEIKPLCLEVQAFLLLHNRVELAKTLDVGGVHLEKTSILPSKARLELGPAAVIGVTANTIDDIKAVRSLDVDYITIGPYKESDLFDQSVPVLGLDGIKALDSDMQKLEINIAHVAAGSVSKNDVKSLLEAGVNGIAVSKDIAFAADVKKETEEFLDILKPFEKFSDEA
ncbi:MAG: thiamine phosphate synthase [Muribaculaceae bacterium]|nr:thiamine phosphate synthase [Muribaculaceae bacterium]